MGSELISGVVGQLEVIKETPDVRPQNVVAIVCHPHPQFAGTMNNKVVVTLAKAMRKLGATTVRFNYRGVGRSDGVYDNAIGEVDDLLAVAKWLQSDYPKHALWLAGFSFGAYIAAKGATLLPAERLITVAPSVVNMDYHHLPPITVPWLVIQGLADEVVSAEAVVAYVSQLDPAPTIITLPKVGHFFHGKLLELEQIVIDDLSNLR